MTRLQKRYIDANYGDLTLEEISSDLNMPLEDIEQYVASAQTPVKPRSNGSIDSLLAKRDGVCVMTPAASMEIDSKRHKPKTNLDHTHKIFEDEL